MAVRIESNAEPIPGYRLIERLGGGGFGEVWKCEAPGGLHKAIKFVFGTLEMAGDSGHRAEQELKALSRVKTVRHPYILSLERFDIVDGQLFIIMELADRNLWDRFKECRTQGLTGIPREELLSYMQESAEALDLMNIHYQLQHLDIKPQNIFLVHQHVKVADFGLVKDLEGSQASVTGGITPVYAAPETFEGKVTRFSDQYSLAIVYQELLTGKRPFAGTNVRQLVLQHMQAEPNVSYLDAPDRPIIRRALSKISDDRWPNCMDMVKALRLATASDAVATEHSSPQPAPVPSALSQTPAPPGKSTRSGEQKRLPPVPSAERARDSTQQATHFIGVPAPGGTGQKPAPVLSPPHNRTMVPAAPAHPSAAGAVQPPPQRAETEREGALFPVLIVGVGGLGGQVLHAFRAGLAERFGSPQALPNVRTLLIDTDPDVLKQLGNPGPGNEEQEEQLGNASGRLPGVALTSGEFLQAPLNRPSHYLKTTPGKIPVSSWLNQRMLYRIQRDQLTESIRALGRLAFFDHFRHIQRRLQVELEACRDLNALQNAGVTTGLGVRASRPRVFLVAGLMGGTGGGMFLDLAYLLRHLLRQLGLPSPEVTGLFFVPRIETSRPEHSPEGSSAQGTVLMPAQFSPGGVAPPVSPSPVAVTRLGNACAALTELLYYSRPDTEFQARFQESEPGLQDSGEPFSSCYLLPLADGAAKKETPESVGMAGRFLLAECASAFGRWRKTTASTPPPPSASPSGGTQHLPGLDPVYRTFGLYRVAFPRKEVVRAVAGRCLQKIVERWLSKDARPLEDRVREWVLEQWRGQDLGAEHFIGRVQQACEKRLGKDPERAFHAVLESVLEPGVPTDARQKFLARVKQGAVPLGPQDVQEVLARYEHILGRPEITEEGGAFRAADWGMAAGGDPAGGGGTPTMTVQLPGQDAPQTGTLVQALREAASAIANEWSQKLAELPVKLIELPAFRLAGAEEAVRQVVKTIEQVLERHEPLGHELADRAATAYGRLRQFLTQLGDARSWPRRGLTPETALELLNVYAKARYQSLVLGQVLAVYISMRGCLTDELREINFCRARLKELLALVEAGIHGTKRADAKPSGSSAPASRASADGKARYVFPKEWASVEEAVKHVFGGLSEVDLLELDGRVQTMIRSKFVALVHLCVNSKNMTRDAAEAMRDVAAAFIEERIGPTDVAELLLRRSADEISSVGELVNCFAEAAPEPATSAVTRSAHPPGEQVVVGVPATAAGAEVCGLARQALPAGEVLRAASEDDLLFYREWNNLPLVDADVLGPAGREAYQQLLAGEDYTPHTRTDVSFEDSGERGV